MKKTLAVATVAALVGVAGAANAADMYTPSGGGLKDVPAYTPPPIWTGFYIGAHVGGFWIDEKNRDIDDLLGLGFDHGFGNNNNNSGVFGGGTVGYNWQAGNWGFGSGSVVLGVEADFGGAGLTDNSNNGFAVGTPGFFWTKNNADFYADVTGRIGYAVGPALFYAKGGWAFLDSNFRVGGITAPGGVTPGGVVWSTNNNNNGLDGWTVGGGIEYLFAPSWSVKAEYLFFDFGRNHVDWVDSLGDDFRFDRELQVNSFKVGVNYHFNNFYAPLK